MRLCAARLFRAVRRLLSAHFAKHDAGDNDFMTEMTPIAVRRSITELQDDYANGNKEPLETLMRAWRGIKALDPSDPNSYFTIGGFHGEPFRGAGATSADWWGGFCEHGSVLFPTWHRAYLHRIEEALRSIRGCENVSLAFWDECSEESAAGGLPWAFTAETFELDGETIPNPLKSFVLPLGFTDSVADDPVNYSKPAGYETVRYPLSGLVGTAEDRANTAAHNAQYPDYETNVGILNGNITRWLNQQVMVHSGTQWVPRGEIRAKYEACCDAPNYTLFSNTTSMNAWNAAHSDASQQVTALESPHNSMHLAVGGCDVPGYDASAIAGANGDMGENDTAGLDPVFFFHHCFVDYVFWTWQRRQGATDRITIDQNDPGANSATNPGQPPSAGRWQNEQLTLDSPLSPFTMGDEQRPVMSRDVVNIETQLGYTYGPGSLDYLAGGKRLAAAAAGGDAGRLVRVAGLNRNTIRGSFVIAAFAEDEGGERRYLGHEAVLSRWHVEGCANCQNHLEAAATFVLPAEAGGHMLKAAAGSDGTSTGAVTVEVHTRDGILTPDGVRETKESLMYAPPAGEPKGLMAKAAATLKDAAAGAVTASAPTFRVEIV